MHRTWLLALVTPVLCADVTVVWKHEKASKGFSLAVHESTSDELLAYSCSKVIEGAHPIDFSNLDDNGFGNFTIGDKEYKTRHDPELSGGPTCMKMFNGAQAIVECSGLEWDASDAKKDLDCGGDVGLLNELPASVNSLSSATADDDEEALDKRQIICTRSSYTEAIGDGDPHQNYYHRQISENFFCGAAPSCSVGYEQTESYTIGWASDISAAGWISAGFAVQQSWETGNQYTCYGESGDTICTWYNTAHTAYTVRNVDYNSCNSPPNDYSDPFVMYSPNQNNIGGGEYCVIGTCRNINAAYWDRTGRAGGP